MASQKSKRARKRRNPAAAPRAVPSQRREQRAERDNRSDSPVKVAERVAFGTGIGSSKGYGERPPSPFGGLPVSEFAIFLGLVSIVVWWLAGLGNAALVTGIVVMTFGVLEFTVREHFSGYRSHAALLSMIPSIGLGVGLVVASGETSGHAPLLFVAIPVYALLFWPLRKRFQIARHARIVRPPAPKSD